MGASTPPNLNHGDLDQLSIDSIPFYRLMQYRSPIVVIRSCLSGPHLPIARNFTISNHCGEFPVHPRPACGPTGSAFRSGGIECFADGTTWRPRQAGQTRVSENIVPIMA
jgi:hypothetical protein